MLRPKEFLAQQQQWVDEAIKDALRHEYGPAESNLFFEECQTRLNSYVEAAAVVGNDPHKLFVLLSGLSDLGALVDRIQRSRLGEFPWTFAEELRTLAEDLFDSRSEEAPLFYFSADGRLDDYRVHNEQDKYKLFKRPIFNVVFPRTLRHQVLIHAVLGHEIGHAFLSMTKSEEIREKLIRILFASGPLSSVERFSEIARKANFSDSDSSEMLRCWREEFCSDLLGLLLLGPSFVPAFLSVLTALDPTAIQLDAEHPPPVCRFFVLRHAIEELGWVKKLTGSKARDAEGRLWKTIDAFSPQSSVGEIVDVGRTRAAVRFLQSRLKRSGVLFDSRDLKPVGILVAQILDLVPPVGPQDIEKSVPASLVDFRAILYAGWLAWEDRRGKKARPNFDDLNRLCELAIVQQRGVARVVASPKDGA